MADQPVQQDDSTTVFQTPQQGDPEATELELAGVLEAYARDVEGGLDPDPQDCLTLNPDLADDLKGCLVGLAAMQELRQALGLPSPPPRERTVRNLGDYEVLGELGRGGMGVVYRARHTKLGRLVALKMIRSSSMAGTAEIERFRNEASIVACLDHPGITPIYEVGEHGGELFYSMKLIEGGKLSDYLAHYQADPRAAARLVAQIARAVHHAHQRGILHRDLKPANVLLAEGESKEGSQSPLASGGRGVGGEGDAHSQSAIRNPQSAVPYVTDFGLARRIETDSGLTQEGTVVGTPSYMAPEQAAGQRAATTTASDVYGLGGILFALLTGKPPFSGHDVIETLRMVRDFEVERPATLNPRVDRDLETICLKCLEKDPARRYSSAEALAQDLDLWLEGAPIKARKVSKMERAWRWCWRHPAAAGTIFAVALLLLGTGFKAMLTAQERRTRLEEEVLRSNVYAAQGMASTILWQLERLSLPVMQMAEDSKTVTLLKRGDGPALQRYLGLVHRQYADPNRGFTRPGQETPFKTWYVLDAAGTLIALYPPPRNPKIIGTDYSSRDYFQGALRHAGHAGRAAVHLSRIFKADNGGIFKIALSAVVRDTASGQGKILGVLAASITTSSTLGSLPLGDSRHVGILVGRHDTTPLGKAAGPASPKIEYLALLHPGYERGEDPVLMTSDKLVKLHRPQDGNDEFLLPDTQRWSRAEEAADPHHSDPVGQRDTQYAGRWLAGFAPVGNTEFVVIVQQRYADVIELDQRLFRDLLIWAGVAGLLGLSCVGGLVWYATRREKRLAG